MSSKLKVVTTKSAKPSKQSSVTSTAITKSSLVKPLTINYITTPSATPNVKPNIKSTTSNIKSTTSNIKSTTSNIKSTTSNIKSTTSNIKSTTSKSIIKPTIVKPSNILSISEKPPNVKSTITNHDITSNIISNIWTEKYKPKKISEIVCNTGSVKAVYNWLTSFDKKKLMYLKQIRDKKNNTKDKKTKNTVKGKIVNNVNEKVNNVDEKVNNVDEKVNNIDEQVNNVDEKVNSDDKVNDNKINDDDDDTSKANMDKKNIRKEKYKSCLIVTGGHGVGKTTAINIILNELNYDTHKMDFSKLKNSVNIKEYIDRMLTSSNIMSVIDNSVQKKLVIVIDELESITSSTEKSCIQILQKLNDIEWYFPIIIISNNTHHKLLSELKKSSDEIPFYTPYVSELKKIVYKICSNEKLNIKIDSVIEKIIMHSQFDIRRLINTLYDIKSTYHQQHITQTTIEEYCEISNKKDVDLDLYKATNELLYKYSTINDCLRIYETEKTLIPLMIHQNYVRVINSNVDDIDRKFELTQEIADYLSMGDVIENYIYGDQIWDLQEIHGFYTCVATSYNICQELSDDPSYIKIDFALDLNKTSIKQINKKNITNTDSCFKNMNISDYIYLNKIIRSLIENNKLEECVKLLKEYNIKLEHIESLLKIDKIKNTKTNLTSKQKKDFIKYIN